MPDAPDNPQTLERKLATILSADIAEFSRLMGEDEEGTLRTFRGHKQVFESLVAMHRGRIFNTAGDAILAEFTSAVEAVRCATDIQAALHTLNDKLPSNRQVRFRIGINLGDVMVQGSDLMGDGVNVAARLQTAAEPGGICISGSVHDQIRNKLSLSFLSLGEKNFKNIQQPVRTFAISEAEGAGVLPSTHPESIRRKSDAAKWIAAAVVLLLAGGGYWAYTASQRSKAEHAQATAGATQPAVTTPAAAPPSASSTTPSPSQPIANPSANSPPPVATGNPPASSASSPAAPVPHPRTPRVSAEAPVSAPTIDGVYAGAICFAKTEKEPQRCFRAEGTVNGGKITAQWMMGHEKIVAMLLNGTVAKSGEVKIEMEMHADTANGERLSTIDVAGTLHDDVIDANGSFRNGRPATLNWRKTQQPLASVSRADLCVTEGIVEEAPGKRLSVRVPKMRAYLIASTPQVIESRFTYLGPTKTQAALGSGEMRQQFGLELRDQDACNLVYAMWRIAPASDLVVSVKSNPGLHTSAQCGNHGYQNIQARHSMPVPALHSGETHTLRAEMDEALMKVFVDDAVVWEGFVGAQARSFEGPVGMRSDNASLQFELLVPQPIGAPLKNAPACRAETSE